MSIAAIGAALAKLGLDNFQQETVRQGGVGGLERHGTTHQLTDPIDSLRLRGIIFGKSGENVTVTRNAQDQITKITDDLATWTVTYDANGFVSQIVQTDGTHTETLVVTRNTQDFITSIARTVA